jgi:MarR family transcriptional regulator for hemolysin
VTNRTIDYEELEIKALEIDAQCYRATVRPSQPPTGLELAAAARTVRRGFDEALAQVGGSLPVWLILLRLKAGAPSNQRELAEAVGLREATLTHHLNAMERDDLVSRRRDAANRRVHVVELTGAGEAAFVRLRHAAVAFDRQLRRGVTDQELDVLRDVLGRLTANVAAPELIQRPPWGTLEHDR